MKEHPMLMNAPMVRAILAGTKTQTRRVIKPQPPRDCAPIRVEEFHPTVIDRNGDEQPGAPIFGAFDLGGEWGVRCPYGQPGDRLWVRETWGTATGEHSARWKQGTILYRADAGIDIAGQEVDLMRWKPSIHMPRWASRITLEIISIRVEQLQDISRGDAMEEGCPFPNMAKGDDPRKWYADLWEQINGPDSWEQNPWVWVVEFRRL